MDKKTIQQIAVIVVGIMLILAVFVARGSKSKRASARLHKSSLSLQTQAGPTADQPNGLRKKLEEELRDFQFERDPFVKWSPRQTEAKALRLMGILWDPQRPAAIINDVILLQGETIGKYRVIAIAGDYVIVTDGHEKIKLNIDLNKP